MTDKWTPEDGIDEMLEGIGLRFGPDQDMIDMLESIIEALTFFRTNPAYYMREPQHLEPILDAAKLRLATERARRAGQIH